MQGKTFYSLSKPIDPHITSNVEAGHLAYDVNRPDLKKGKSIVTNHYRIIGDYILPKGYPLKRNQSADNGQDNAAEEIADFTSKINMPHVTLPAYMPEGSTHLRVK